MNQTLEFANTEPLPNGWFQFTMQTTLAPDSPVWQLRIQQVAVYPLWPLADSTNSWLACCATSPENIPDQPATVRAIDTASPGKGAKTMVLASDEGLLQAIAWLAAHRSSLEQGEVLVLADWNTTLPFQPQPSLMVLPHLPHEVTASISLLEDWKIPARFASRHWRPGFFEGSARTLAAPYMAEGWQPLVFTATT
jgi:hypothetical protein